MVSAQHDGELAGGREKPCSRRPGHVDQSVVLGIQVVDPGQDLFRRRRRRRRIRRALVIRCRRRHFGEESGGTGGQNSMGVVGPEKGVYIMSASTHDLGQSVVRSEKNQSPPYTPLHTPSSILHPSYPSLPLPSPLLPHFSSSSPSPPPPSSHPPILTPFPPLSHQNSSSKPNWE